MRKHPQGGFTLIEMIVAVSIMAILLGIAVPSFRDASLSSQLRSLSSELVSGMSLARSEAIKRNAVATMCVSTSGDACTSGTWDQGWIVSVGGTTIKRISAAPAGFKISAASALTTLSFQPTGVNATAATMTVCRATPPGAQERVVSVNAAGRAYSRRTTTGVCT